MRDETLDAWVSCQPLFTSVPSLAFNLLVAVWLRNVVDGQRLETLVTRKVPHVEIVDRSVVIGPFKLVGRMLDTRGFATGVVPLELDGVMA